MMDLVFIMMNFAFKIMDFVFKMIDFVFKMIAFVFKMMILMQISRSPSCRAAVASARGARCQVKMRNCVLHTWGCASKTRNFAFKNDEFCSGGSSEIR